MLYAAFTVESFGGSGGRFLFFHFFVGDGAWDDVGEEFKVVQAGYGAGCCMLVGRRRDEERGTKISVLNVTAGFALGFDDIVALLGYILDEHFLVSISRCRMKERVKRTVAKVMTNAALFEHMLISES